MFTWEGLKYTTENRVEMNILIIVVVTAGAWVFFYYLIEYTIGWGKEK